MEEYEDVDDDSFGEENDIEEDVSEPSCFATVAMVAHSTRTEIG